MKSYYEHQGVTIIHGHVLDALKNMESESVQCCVTSPPYWGLRDYGLDPQIWDGDPSCEHEWGDQIGNLDFGRHSENALAASEVPKERRKYDSKFCQICGAWKGSLGLEPTPELYVQHLIQIFREIRRVLKKGGTLWLNLGDSYASGKGSCFNPGGGEDSLKGHKKLKDEKAYKLNRPNISDLERMGLKPKDLVGIPWRVAFALQADGWWLRSDIIWNKPNPMPESVKDRPSKSHEYIFLLTKSRKYYYNNEAIKEKASPESHARYGRGRSDHHKWADGGPGNQTIAKSLEHMKAGVNPKAARAPLMGRYRPKQNESFSSTIKDLVEYRNKRTVWTIPTQPSPEIHFATFPEKLVEPCILAGSRIGDAVFDPFAGVLTVARVAKRLNRKAVLIELKEEYIKMGVKYLTQDVLQFRDQTFRG